MSNQQSEDNRSSVPAVRQAESGAILRWLSLGWNDMRAARHPSLMHGFIVSLVCLAIAAVAINYWQLLPAAASAFLLTGPFLATGLYALSSKLERNEPISFHDVFHAWRGGSKCLFVYGTLLLTFGLIWTVFSLIMFQYFISTVIETPIDFLRYVLQQDNFKFMLWSVLGGLLLSLAFGITVIAMPFLVDRDVTTKTAIQTSIRVVGENPITMAWWAMVITFLTGFSFMTLTLGFIVFYPLLGHASWHVYRELVDADALPLRHEID